MPSKMLASISERLIALGTCVASEYHATRQPEEVEDNKGESSRHFRIVLALAKSTRHIVIPKEYITIWIANSKISYPGKIKFEFESVFYRWCCLRICCHVDGERIKHRFKTSVEN